MSNPSKQPPSPLPDHSALTPHVTLGPGIRLDVRFLGVASFLGLLLLPPATQICGKRVFGVV